MEQRKPSSVEVLSGSLIAELTKKANTRRYARNAIIVSEGDESDSLYVILAGKAKVFVSGSDGREMELNRIGPGEYFGEVALDGGLRSASVMAVEDCQCAVLTRAQVAAFMSEQPEFGLHLLRKLAHRVRALTSNVSSLALMDVYGRVARLLLDLAEEDGGLLVVKEKLTQKDIGQRVGASREMISRVFSDLVEGGYLKREDGRLLILRKPPARW